MAKNFVNGMPGVRAERSAAPRTILAGADGAVYLPAGRVLDGSLSRDPENAGDEDVLRAGLLLGRVSASGKYAPSVLGELAEAYDHEGQSNTTMTLTPQAAAELVRRVGSSGSFRLTGPATAGGEVVGEEVDYSAVDVETGAVTVTAASSDFIAGSLVQPTDGSETPRGLIGDGYGIQVTDGDGEDLDVPLPNLLIGGIVDAGRIVSYPSDSALKAWVKSALRAVGCGLAFDDEF